MAYDLGMTKRRAQLATSTARMKANIMDIVMTDDLETRVNQALTQLIAQAPARKSAWTQQMNVLDKFIPMILSARAKNRSWASISLALKAEGISVSKETLRRIVTGGKKARKPATKKAAKIRAVNASIKSPENHETIHAEFAKPADDYLSLERVVAGTGGPDTVWAQHVRAAQADADHPLRRQFVREAAPKIVTEIPSPDPEILETVIQEKPISMFGAALET